jgi:hypothetical protein
MVPASIISSPSLYESSLATVPVDSRNVYGKINLSDLESFDPHRFTTHINPTKAEMTIIVATNADPVSMDQSLFIDMYMLYILYQKKIVEYSKTCVNCQTPLYPACKYKDHYYMSFGSNPA